MKFIKNTFNPLFMEKGGKGGLYGGCEKDVHVLPPWYHILTYISITYSFH